MRKNFSRREFLGVSAAAAGATLAAKTILLDPEPLFAASTRFAASDRLRFGMIGIGMQGNWLLEFGDRAAGCGMCSRLRSLRRAPHPGARDYRQRRPCPSTRRYQELLEDKSIDCIIAAVPDHWHKQIVVDAVSAGKDIYCEKPMSHAAGGRR